MNLLKVLKDGLFVSGLFVRSEKHIILYVFTYVVFAMQWVAATRQCITIYT